MAKIIKIGSQNLTPKIANPFKTSRNSTTNPFKYSNFEGNTLQFADVFEGFEPKKTNKLKMIASSVAGSMTKLRSSIAEPIVNFVNRVRGGISNAWDFAKNVNLADYKGLKTISNVMDMAKNSMSKGLNGTAEFLNQDVSVIGKGLSGTVAFLNKDVAVIGKEMSNDISGFGKELSSKWNALISKINHKKISADTPVAELEQMWRNEIALEAGGAA